MHWFDIAFLLALFGALPLYSAKSYKKYLALADQGIEPDRVVMYSQTMVMQWAGFLVLMFAWLLLDRSMIDLGFTAGSSLGYLVGGAALLLLLAVFGYQLYAIRRLDWQQKKAQLEGLGDIAYALPRTRREYVYSNLVSVTAGVVEEIVYRGFVIWLLSLYMPLVAAAVVSSAAFGLAHLYQGWSGVLKTGVLGGIFAAIYLVAGTIWIPVVLHALLDILQMAAVRELHIDRSQASADPDRH